MIASLHRTCYRDIKEVVLASKATLRIKKLKGYLCPQISNIYSQKRASSIIQVKT